VLKSPLAVPGAESVSAGSASGSLALTLGPAALTEREATLAEFQGYLRTVNNRAGRPFEEKTITAYSDPVKSLDRWMTATGIDGDFTVVDTALLNRYFREYYLEHGQGGTHTQQRNLIQLFNFLERERGFATPYADGLNRYATVKGRPKTLYGQLIDDLLEVTGNGRARDFETARDHAIIRILRSEGIRRMELLGMVMHTMPADVTQNPMFRLVPLKGARAAVRPNRPISASRSASGSRGQREDGKTDPAMPASSLAGSWHAPSVPRLGLGDTVAKNAIGLGEEATCGTTGVGPASWRRSSKRTPRPVRAS